MKSPFSWRRGITTCIACALFALGASVCAQPAAKGYRIGVLNQGNPPQGALLAADFRQGLRDGAMSKARTSRSNSATPSGNVDKLPELASEFVR